jgi:pyrimidine-nucleoside phosphorylase
VQILKGECQGDLKELSVLLAAELVYASSIAQSSDDAKTMAETALKNGEALHKFKAMVVAQKGNTAFIDNPDSIIHASIRHDILFDAEGYFTAIDTYRLGVAAAELGAGRKTKDDAIDPSVGIWMHKRIGDHIKKGDRLCTLYANDESKLNTALEALQGSIRISQTSCEMPKLVYARVTADGVEEY